MPLRISLAAFPAAAVIAVLSCAAASPARAATIYTTFGPGDAVNTAQFPVRGPDNLFIQFGPSPANDFAGLFTVSQSFTFDAARAAFKGIASGANDHGVILQLVADDAGHPGSTVIEDLGSQPVIGAFNVQTYSSTLHPLLAPGSYWLVAIPLGPTFTGSWYASPFDNAHPSSPANHFGNANLTDPSTTWTVFNDPIGNPGFSLAPAFEIDGTLALAAVPLPRAAFAAPLLLIPLLLTRARRRA